MYMFNLFNPRRQSLAGFRHDKQRRTERRKLLGYFLLCAIILLVFQTSLFNLLSPIFFQIARPLWVAEHSAVNLWMDVRGLFSFKESLVRENRRLSETLDLVSLEAYSREQLRDENERLRGMLSRVSTRSLLLTRVLATPGRSPYDTLFIDAGLEEGLTSGMKVFTDGDFVIGEISRVMKGGATVMLYSSYGNELSVTVGTSSIPATARGQGGGNFRITLPRGLSVLRGDLVHIPALAPEYVGIVEAVDRPTLGSLQNLYLRWPFNVNELTWVYIAIDSRITAGRAQ